jgi:hypothetical protein
MIRYHKTINKILPRQKEERNVNTQQGGIFLCCVPASTKEKTTSEGWINEDANLRGGSRHLLLRPDPENSVFDLA